MAAVHRSRALVAELEQGVARLVDSERWRAHLEVQSRFHHYSFGNVALIGQQRPDATRVAGFRAWQALGRSVRRGERAIWILAPLLATRSLDEDAEEGQGARIVRGFKAVPVFDVSQTDGAPLPSVCEQLDGDDPLGAYRYLEQIGATVGFRIEEHELESGTNGDCSHAKRLIRVERRNAPAQRAKTLAHELAHALLHEHFVDRGVAELEAESVAYVVCRSLGLDTSEYSFGYVALWAGGGSAALAGLRGCGERIQKAAAALLARHDARSAGEDPDPDPDAVAAA